MKEFLDCVPYTKYDLFKEKAKKHCGWSNDQYWNRKTGKTKLTASERTILVGILNELQAETVEA